MSKVTLVKLSEVNKAAKQVSVSLKNGEILGLVGQLGSGKTTFTKALCKQLKVKHKVTSPSFGLIHIFPAKLKAKKILVYHLDLYRIKNFHEIKTLGLTEFWGKPDTVTIIEWANKISRYWPKKIRVFKFFSDIS